MPIVLAEIDWNLLLADPGLLTVVAVWIIVGGGRAWGDYCHPVAEGPTGEVRSDPEGPDDRARLHG